MAQHGLSRAELQFVLYEAELPARDTWYSWLQQSPFADSHAELDELASCPAQQLWVITTKHGKVYISHGRAFLAPLLSQIGSGRLTSSLFYLSEAIAAMGGAPK